MARTHSRFLGAIVLAVALVPLRAGSVAHKLFGVPPTTVHAQSTQYPPGYDLGGLNSNAAALPAGPGYPTTALGNQNYGPSSPTPPANPARPASWPGQAPQQPAAAAYPPGGPNGANPPAHSIALAPPPARKDPLEPPIEPATILAHVGFEVVQASEILPTVHKTLETGLEKNRERIESMPESMRKEQLKHWYREVLEKTLNDAITVKLLLMDVKSVAPEEAIKKNQERFRQMFNDEQIKKLMIAYKATSVIDLDNKLRAQGGSLESQRMMFVDQYLAFGWLHQQVREEGEPSHEQMVTYYREHIADWERPARARWEQLTARFDKFPSHQAARGALMQWGDDVWRGVPLAQVAKARSQGYSAEEGGLNDWTTQGSLRSAGLDRALFGLPVGALSQIIEDEDGFHIVRVVEREEQHTIPFVEVQSQIKEKLQTGDKNTLMSDYVAKLRERTPVHTVFDGDASSIANRPGGTTR